jgi:AcrR family transcriptional regulator
MATASGGTDPSGPAPWGEALSARRLRTAERIALVGAAIIDREGIAGLTMSRLADESGVSRQTLYKYYADVDAVLEGIAAIGAVGVRELALAVAAEDDAHRALRLFVQAVLAAAAAGHPSPMALAAAVPATSREAMRGHEEAAENIVIELVRRGQAEGAFRADAEPELDGRLIYRTTLAAHDLAARPGADVDRLAEHVAESLYRMVAVSLPAPRD